MTEFRADLHCHTTCSDGSDDPETVLKKAKEAGLSGLSITDHDTIEAYTPKFFALARELQIRLLPGIELSSEWERSTVHVLGYGFDLESAPLKDFLVEMVRRRNTRNQAMVAKLREKGLMIDLKATSHPTGRPHIANELIRKGYVNSMQEAFDKYLKEGAPCYVPGIKFTPRDVIDIIHTAKGKAVLAHPHFIKSNSHLKQLLNLPFDGLECHYGILHKEQERPWLERAQKKGLIPTGGSDYHGAIKPHISLGCSWVSEEIFNRLSC